MSFSKKTISIISASAIALGTCIPAGLAFADPDPVDPPSVGDQSGAGSTAMTMVWDNADQEYGGTEDPNNPPSDPNDPTSPGENLAFKAPTAINFVAKANGTLLAPQSGIHIDNYSSYGIRVSSMKIDQSTGWNIVADAASSSAANAVSGNIGPAADQLAWASYIHEAPSTAPIAVTKDYAWNMAATDGADGGTDELALSVTESKVSNLNMDLSTAKTFGTIHWYLKAGNVDATPTSLGDYTMTQLKAVSASIRANDENAAGYIATFEPWARAGQTVQVTLGDSGHTTVNATLVDVDQQYGLVFMLDKIATTPMYESGHNGYGWDSSDLRTSLQSGTLYTTYLQGMTMSLADDTAQVVEPVEVTTFRCEYGDEDAVTHDSTERASTDTFFLASSKEVFSEVGGSITTYSACFESRCHQFDYFGPSGLNVTGASYSALAYNSDIGWGNKADGSTWWLRSWDSETGVFACRVYNTGQGEMDNNDLNDSYAVLPCFCL